VRIYPEKNCGCVRRIEKNLDLKLNFNGLFYLVNNINALFFASTICLFVCFHNFSNSFQQLVECRLIQ